MILTLIKRDQVFRSMKWLPIGLAMGAFLLALKETPPPGLPFFARDFRPQYLFFPALFFWATLVPYLLASGATVSTGKYHMTLPIPARTVWLSHILALAISAFAVLALAAVVLIVGNHLQGKPWLEPDLASVMLNAAAFIGIGLILTHMPRRSLSELPLPGPYIGYLLLVWVGLILLVPIVSALPPYWATVPAALALGLAVTVYHSLPLTFALVPRTPAPHSPGESPVISADGKGRDGETPSRMVGRGQQPSRWLFHRTMVRSLYNPVIAPIVFVAILVFGFRNSGYNHNGVSNLVFIWWTLVGLSTLLLTGAVKLHLLDPLPISRKVVFAYFVLPGLLFAFLSYGLGVVTGKGAAGRGSLVEYEERYYDRQLDVRVPLEFWEIGQDGQPTPLEPCCDEPHAAWSVSFFKGSDLVLYNPYHAPADSSPEFVANQFSRAAGAVYGRQIPTQDLLDRYFERRPDGGTALKVGGLNLLEDYPGLKPAAWGGYLAVILASIGVAWLLYLALVFRLGQPRIMQGHVTLTILSVVFLFTMIWTSNQGYTDEWKLSVGAAIFARDFVKALPGSTLTVWVIAISSIVACYMLARAQFVRMEITVKPEPK
jgi:hypothetical protein